MLVLGRTIGKRIVFPDLGISVTVVQIHRNEVKLGIEAPKQIRCHREEVQNRIEAGQPEHKILEHRPIPVQTPEPVRTWERKSSGGSGHG